MEEWIGFAGQFGLPVMMLAALCWFVAREVWPWVKRQIEETQAQRKLEIERFVETIRTRDALLAEMQREHLKALDAMTDEIRGLREEIRSHKSR